VIVFSDVYRSIFDVEEILVQPSGSKRPRSMTGVIVLTESHEVIIDGSQLMRSYSHVKSALGREHAVIARNILL
jgi:hypothetical protein